MCDRSHDDKHPLKISSRDVGEVVFPRNGQMDVHTYCTYGHRYTEKMKPNICLPSRIKIQKEQSCVIALEYSFNTWS